VGNLIDHTGSRFGLLQVLSRAPDKVMPSGRRATHWNVRCDCGTEKTVDAGALTAGRVVSCGCHRRRLASRTEDLSGERFGCLVVLNLAGRHIQAGGQAKTLWDVRCDCGTETVVQAGKLRSGHTTSCGCAVRRMGEDNPLWRGSNVGYGAAHTRVMRARGRPSEHPCLDCGGPAADWSYNGLAGEDELVDPRGLRYSPHISDYDPRCKRCHKRQDMELAKGRR
jgi:hypothetical protein